jgi:hypothetical protein
MRDTSPSAAAFSSPLLGKLLGLALAGLLLRLAR